MLRSKPRLSSYIVDHDLGFAPNPFHGYCTLAACKPTIRKYAIVGDWVLGTGGASEKMQGRIIYIARVSEIVDFDAYWSDYRFSGKKPILNGSYMLRYGDNIYHHSKEGDWIQEDSFHSRPRGVLDCGNLERDTGSTERVLICSEFAYFGAAGPLIPQEFQDFVHKTQGHHNINALERIGSFLAWVGAQGDGGILGPPAGWRRLS